MHFAQSAQFGKIPELAAMDPDTGLVEGQQNDWDEWASPFSKATLWISGNEHLQVQEIWRVRTAAFLGRLGPLSY